MTRLSFWLRNLPHRVRGWREELGCYLGTLGLRAELSVTVIRRDGTRIPLGLVSRRVITTAGATKVADAFVNTFEPELFNYHAFGTGAVAENITDTALGTELSTRGTGTQSKPSALVYQTVGTVSFTTTSAVTEHGILSQSAVGGTLLDRSVFAAINVVNGDSIQATYQLTVATGT